MNITDKKLSVAIKAVAMRFGYAELKPCQAKAVKSFVSGNDLFLSRVWEIILLCISPVSLKKRVLILFYILKLSHSVLIISIFYVISTSDNQHTNVQYFL